MKKTAIDLTDWYRRQASLEATVLEATKALNRANRKLTASNSTAREAIVALLDKGGTTGDKLQDAAIRILGLRKLEIEQVLAFNKRLCENKGRELLIIHQYSIQIAHRGPGDERESDFVHPKGYIFGRLSGEPLKLLHDTDTVLSLPFERHIYWGFQRGGPTDPMENQPVVGKKLFEGSSLLNLGRPTAGQILQWIIGAESDTSLYIGQEITVIAGQGKLALNLEDARKKLDSATPEESVMAEAI